jgi:hypothetical protein
MWEPRHLTTLRALCAFLVPVPVLSWGIGTQKKEKATDGKWDGIVEEAKQGKENIKRRKRDDKGE